MRPHVSADYIEVFMLFVSKLSSLCTVPVSELVRSVDFAICTEKSSDTSTNLNKDCIIFRFRVCWCISWLDVVQFDNER